MERLHVQLDFGTQQRAVGELIQRGTEVLFRFDRSFLDNPLPISPIRLPVRDGTQIPNTSVFEGLFGVFADSLSDGWGRLLQDRAFTERGIPLETVTPLLRLANVGATGMGALTYHPPRSEPVDGGDLDLDELAAQSQRLLAGERIDNLDELLQLGGSSGGARPKLLVGYHPGTHQLIADRFPLPEGYEHWIIKFNASIDTPDAAELEFIYSEMARAAGLEVQPCRLFRGKSGRAYFGTKRFDRTATKRFHLHSAAGLLHDNFRLSALDYGHLMDAAWQLTQTKTAMERILRMAAFNVFAFNRDDHSKNCSFLMDETGAWRVAPAYDLTFSRTAHGEHSTTVAGEGRHPGTKQLLELADTFGIRSARQMIDEVKSAIVRFEALAQPYDLTAATQTDVLTTLKRQLKQ